MLIHATCKNCGKEFEYEGTGGRCRAYCSLRCKIKRDNQAFNDSIVAKTGQNYWKWKYDNDLEYRKKRKIDNAAGAKRRREERRVEVRDALIVQIRDAKTLEEAIELFEKKARIRSENYA